jgi:serine/threonine protein kinase
MLMTTSYVYQLDGTIEPFASSQAPKVPFIPVFRKMTNCNVELQIAKMLMENKYCQKNIVKIYDVTSTYYTMELLETNYILDASIIEKMQKVKTYMQSINIAYIDWKPDNIGIDENGEPKLFDFDGCGIYENNEWIISPFRGYAYNDVSKTVSDPVKIDDACFRKYLRFQCASFQSSRRERT